MGRAVILSGGADGLYTIEQDFSLPGQEAELAALRAKKTELDATVKLVKEALALKVQEVEEAVHTLSAMIKDWQARLMAGEDPDPPVSTEPEEPGEPASLAVPNAAAQCLAAHNAIRAGAGLGALTYDPALAGAAQGHADWLAANNATGHTGAGGSSPAQRIANAGYPGGPGGLAAENQASGQSSVTQVMDDWMNSPAHRANVLEARLTQAGIGYAYRPLGLYRHTWVVNFGRLPD